MEVTAGIIQKDGKILICQRPEGKSLAGFWEFPGGKQEPGESLESCLKRELKEELSLKITDINPLYTVHRPESDLNIHFFTCKPQPNSKPDKLEHQAIQWIGPDDLKNFSFCPSDSTLIESVPAKHLFQSPNCSKH